MHKRTVSYLIALFLIAGSLPLASPSAVGADRATAPAGRHGCNACREARAKVDKIDKNAKRASKPPIAAAFNDLPIFFTRNDGQTDEQVRFYERGRGHATYFTDDGVYVRLRKSAKARKATGLKLSALGANKQARIIGESQLPGKVNHFIGSNPKKWRTEIPTYAAVSYRNLYPGIDMKFYAKNQDLEYDMVVRPGAEPSVIQLAVEGIEGLKVSEQGELVMSLKSDEIVQGAPYIYQEIDGNRTEVKGAFRLLKSGSGKKRFAYGFTLGDYDRSRPLIIDPQIFYSSFIGGGSSDSGWGIAADATGNIYICGETESNNFDDNPGFEGDDGGFDGFVSKFNPFLSGAASLVYSTYLGGASADTAYEIEVDPATLNAYVTGFTESAAGPAGGGAGFPITTSGHDTSQNGGRDAFLTVLNAAGSALVYSTFLGTGDTEEGYSVDLDSTNRVYLAGYTNGAAFPTTAGAFDTSHNGGQDAFVTIIVPDANVGDSDVVYSTFVGGSGDEQANGLRVQDSNGNAHITGWTQSSNFPTANAFDASSNGGKDAFVLRLNPAGAGAADLGYSTYLGGSADDSGGGDAAQFAQSPGAGGGIDVDSNGIACVAGDTQSSTFPIVGTGVFDNTHNGGRDVFGARIDTNLSGAASLIYSTFIGGSGADVGLDASADANSGLCCITGFTESSNFPTKDPITGMFNTDDDAALESFNGGVKSDNIDAFIVTLRLDPLDNTPGAPGSPDPADLVFSTFLGGDASDFGAGVDARNSGQCCITGKTLDGSPDNFPTTGTGFQAANDGSNDAFVTCAADVVTAVKLESFTATAYGEGVLLNWRTGNDIDNLGYYIYRDSGGKLTRVTPQPVAGSALLAGPGTLVRAGMSYNWVDSAVSAQKTSYWLDEIDLSGEITRHGPFPIERGESKGGLAGVSTSILLGELNARQARFAQPGQSAAVGRTAKMSAAPTFEHNPAGLPGVKITVKQEGWYRVTQPELAAAGLNAEKTNPRNLQLFVDGQQIPIVVKGEADRKFDPADAVEFYGQGLDTLSTDTRVYWLIAGQQAGMRITQSLSKAAAAAPGSFPYTVELRENLQYSPALLNGEVDNFFGALVWEQPVDQTLTLLNVAQGGGQANLQVALQGLTNEPHQVNVWFNGTIVGAIQFDGLDQEVASFSVNQSALLEGGNIVRLAAAPGTFDFSLVDYIRLTYGHTYRADGDSLRFTATGGRQVTVGGFSSSDVRVMDITDPNAVQEIVGVVKPTNPGYSVTATLKSGGQRTLLALAGDQVKGASSLVANQPSKWRTPGNGADLVMITHSDFAQDLAALKAWRESQGLNVAIADITDIYDEFSYGHKTPQALKDFLGYARSNWTLAPRFALLVGDASMDPRNYMGLGSTDLLPTKLIQASVTETASDDWFADFNGDGLAELAVGRLPARNPTEAARIIQKLISYDSFPVPGGVFLAADANEGYDFEAANDLLRALVPTDIAVDEVRLGDTDPATAKANVLAAINQGRKIVNYSGHGSISFWSGDMLTSADAASLQNAGKWPIVVSMTCLNGYFVDESFSSLAQALMVVEGGAIAVWSSSGFTAPYGQTVANEELFRQLFNGDSVTLGEAALRAKGAITDKEIRLTWVLLGDPTTRLR